MNCNACEKKNQSLKIKYEMEMARLERINFALLMTLILTIILLFASYIYFLKYKSEFEIMVGEIGNGFVCESGGKRVYDCERDIDYYYP